MSNIILTPRILCREMLLLIDNSKEPPPVDKWVEFDIDEDSLAVPLDAFSETVLQPALAKALSSRQKMTAIPMGEEAYHDVKVRCWTCFVEDRFKFLFSISSYQQAAA